MAKIPDAIRLRAIHDRLLHSTDVSGAPGNMNTAYEHAYAPATANAYGLYANTHTHMEMHAHTYTYSCTDTHTYICAYSPVYLLVDMYKWCC